MINHVHEPAKSHNFSLAFEQMCSVVAIADTKNADETLQELILQCFAILPDEHFQNEQHLAEVIKLLFGLQIPIHEVQLGIDRLESNGTIQRTANNELTLPLETRAKLQSRIDEALALEKRVKETWFQELERSFSATYAEAWKVLRNYLASAFRRHGLQTTALLDPSVEIAPEYSQSLSELLEEALKEIPDGHRIPLQIAITSFLANAGKNTDRATYIAQLADGTFNYFSLTIAPDVAERFHEKLNSLMLFLDTNFLYGILDLNTSPQVAVSNELMRGIQKYDLPFKLVYHPRTLRELRTSIDGYKADLMTREWPITLSRAAVTSMYISGVVLRYHQKHLETGIDVDSFFRPYNYLDVILQEKNISAYEPLKERAEERATLFAEFQDWLKQRNRDKSYNLLDHDSTILDQVRELRSSAKSSLDAGALLITCDYMLYKFDWETSKKRGMMASAVLPNLLWQILRPFIPSGSDFDRSFAETFAIPEFRTIGSGSSKACAKLLYILAGYEGLSEETAARMLSNDMLIGRLKSEQDDERFQDYVEAAIVAENSALLEEKAALMQQLEKEKAERESEEGQFQKERSERQKEITQALEQTTIERQARENAENRANQAEIHATEADQRSARLIGVVKSIVLSVIVIAAFEALVYQLPWGWLMSHPNSYAIQAMFDMTITLGLFGLFISDWRKWCWGVAAIPVIIGLLQILGGPRITQ